jgi:hypothetical protein
MRRYLVLILALLGCGKIAPTVSALDASPPDGHPASRDARVSEGGDGEAGRPDAGADGMSAPPDAYGGDGNSVLDAACPSEEAGASPCNLDTTTSCDPLTPCACGGCCVAGICAPQGAACAQNLGVCRDRSCGGCGALGEPCCAAVNQMLYGDPCGTNPPGSAGWWSGPACSDPNTVCTDFDAQPNLCVPCGGAGQPCCEALNHASLGVCGSVQLVCGADGLCTASCDHVGESCCEDHQCQDRSICMFFVAGTYGTCVAGSSCGADDAGACTTCGLSGMACCAGGGCIEGTCAGGTCYVNTMR